MALYDGDSLLASLRFAAGERGVAGQSQILVQSEVHLRHARSSALVKEV